MVHAYINRHLIHGPRTPPPTVVGVEAMSLDLETEVRERLSLAKNSAESIEHVTEYAGSVAAEITEHPLVSTPYLLFVYAIAHKKIDILCDNLGSHYAHFLDSGVLYWVCEFLKTQAEPIALEALAYCKYEHGYAAITSHDVAVPADFAISLHFALKEFISKASNSPSFLQWPNQDTLRRESTAATAWGREESKPAIPFWVAEWLVVNENKAKPFVDEWWPFVIPSLLNSLQTSDVKLKLKAVTFVDMLLENHKQRIQSSGLSLVIQNSVEPCLSFLPPVTSPAETMQIHRQAVDCLAKLADDRAPDNGVARLNLLAREGCLKPFLHTQENVELTIYFFETLAMFVDKYLKSLTAVHLHGIVKAFNQIMCDPFVDYSPPLIQAACNAMAVAIKWAWPRVEKYQYTIALGLVKAGAMDTKCFELLNLSPEEVTQLKTHSETRQKAELDA